MIEYLQLTSAPDFIKGIIVGAVAVIILRRIKRIVRAF